MVYVGADTSALSTAELKVKAFADKTTALLRGMDASVKINTRDLNLAQSQITARQAGRQSQPMASQPK